MDALVWGFNSEELNEGIIQMENEDLSKKPLVEQIYDELFDNIEKHDEFDEGMIKTMKQLAAKGEMKKHGKVMESIKATVVKKDENIGTGN